MTRILCPVDFSDASLNAVDFAAKIAFKYNAKMVLVNVFTEEDFNKIVSSEEITGTFSEQIELANDKLLKIADESRLNNSGGISLNYETKVLTGDLQSRLTAFIEEQDFEMVVMGTVGMGKSKWLGSNTSHFINRVTIPVLCVPAGSVFSGLKKLVYATDMSEEDKIRIQEVISIATVFDSRIYVIHLSQKADSLESHEVTEFYDELKSFTQYNKITFESRVNKKGISEGLLDYMNETESEMLVVYSKHRNFIENLFHKSLAKELSLISKRPIMVLK